MNVQNPKDISANIIGYILEDILFDESAILETDCNLFEEAILDSVSIMRVVAHIEESYQIRIEPVDLVPENFLTIEAMAQYVSKRLGA